MRNVTSCLGVVGGLDDLHFPTSSSGSPGVLPSGKEKKRSSSSVKAPTGSNFDAGSFFRNLDLS